MFAYDNSMLLDVQMKHEVLLGDVNLMYMSDERRILTITCPAVQSLYRRREQVIKIVLPIDGRTIRWMYRLKRISVE